MIQDTYVRGSIISNTSEFVILAYANSAYIERGGSSPPDPSQKSPGWYILNDVYYAQVKEDQTPDGHYVHEAIFTPFFNGNLSIVGKRDDTDDLSVDSFLQLAQYDSNNNCTKQPSPRPFFPFFSDDPKKDKPYRVLNVRPLFLRYTNNNLVTVDGRTLSVSAGQRSAAEPYDAITYISGPGVDNKFSFHSLYGDSDTVFVDPPLLYAGYPYRITSNTAVKYTTQNPVSPFRNFLQNEECTAQNNNALWRYVNYSTRSIDGINDIQNANFPGADYGGDGSYNTPTDDAQFNFPNALLNPNKTNIQDTVQYYLIPTNFYTYGGINCGSFSFDSTNNDQVIKFFNTIIYNVYQGIIPNCNANVQQCLFTSSAFCQTGLWFDYCTDSAQSCGTCYGKCTSEDVNEQYCRLTAAPASGKEFTCGTDPNPQPPPTPVEPNWFDNWKIWLYGAIIIIGIFLVGIIIIIVIMSAMKSN